jgi:hypothetical protein
MVKGKTPSTHPITPIIHQWESENQENGVIPRWLHLLRQRGLSLQTAAYFDIQPYQHGWIYPLLPDHAARRWKAFPGQRGAKYRWIPAQPADITFYDPRGHLAEHVAAAHGVLILASGEADVWALHEAGIRHATATLLGEGHLPDWLVAELHRLNVRRVEVWPDCDQTGLKFAGKLRETLTETGIELCLRALPYAPDSKGDIGRLLIEVGSENLYKTLTNCPPLLLPAAPAPPAVSTAALPPAPPVVAGDTSAREEIERRVRAEIAHVLVKRGRKDGYYCCPLDHGPNGKDFLFNAAPGQPIGGCQGKHAGLFTRWVDLAALLQIDVAHIARAVAEERRPVRAYPPHTASLGSRYTSRFPYGAPETLVKRTLQLSRLVKVQKQAPAAYGIVLWEELRGCLDDDTWVSRGAFQQACGQIGRDPSDDTVKTLLQQLVAQRQVQHLRVVHIEPVESDSGSGDFYNLYMQDGTIYRLQKCALADNKTSTCDLYRFLPVEERLENFHQLYYRALREYAFQHAPDTIPPEFGELSPEQVQAWEDFRSPVYLQYAERREQATRQLERDLGFWEGAKERIEEGRYRAVTLAPGVIRNAADFRAAFKRYLVESSGGELENDYQTARMLGVERSALARINDRAGVIKVARTQVVVADELTQYQRDYLVEAWHADGTATVKRPSAAKLLERATPEEVAAYEEQRAAQRKHRLSVVEPGPEPLAQVAPPLKKPRCRKTSPLPLEMWQGYSEEYQRRQYAYCPLPPEFLAYDSETGELYSMAQLWRQGAEYLKGKTDVQKETPGADAETQSGVPLSSDPLSPADHGTGPGTDRSGHGLAPGDHPGGVGGATASGDPLGR